MKAKEYTSNRIPNCFFKSFCYCRSIIYIKFRILIYLIFSPYPH